MQEMKFERDGNEYKIWISIFNSFIQSAGANYGDQIAEIATKVADQGLQEFRKRDSQKTQEKT